MNSSNKSIVYASLAVLSWSTVATAFKVALSYLTVFQTLFIACATALVIFTVMMTVQKSWGKLRNLSPSLWLLMAFMGLINPVIYYLILFGSYDYLPAQVAQPINYLWPIALLILLAIFNKQPIPKKKYIGMAVSLAGLTMISLGGKSINGELSIVGLSMAGASAVLWAVYWMLNDRIKNKIPESVSLFLGFLFGMVYMSIGACFVDVSIPSASALFAGMYVGAFEIGIPFICFGIAIRTTDNPALINQMCYLAPFMSLFFISMVLHEPIVYTTFIGLVLIIAGIVYNQYFATRTSHASVKA
ncbi:MAG: DMT family transporter [Muribaculum sp.]|nr:DMT family transporter [Muribaculum sp.]